MIQINEWLLSYNSRLEPRALDILDGVVLHCTELPHLDAARQYGERILYPESGTGASGHYYIDRDGVVYLFAEETRTAHHVFGHNETTVGIELVNSGRYPGWFQAASQKMTEPYTEPQIMSLKDLLRDLRGRLPGLERILRHCDLDTRWIPAEDDPSVLVRRRLDPGPMFPWVEMRAFWATLR